MNYKFYIIAFLLMVPIIGLTMPVQAEEGEGFIKVDGLYKVRIESAQWEFKIYDLNRAERDGVNINGEGPSFDTAKAPYEVKHSVSMPDAVTDDQVEFQLYSRDVQHGFSINELDLAVALNRPSAGSEFGQPTIATVTLTAEATENTLSDDKEGSGEGITFSSYCHIFCGLGHPDMKIKFKFGGGSTEWGPIVFAGAILLNVGILGVTLRNILTKVSVVSKEIPAVN